MDDDTRGALGTAVRSGGSPSATASGPSRRPLALAALVGVTVAAVPSLGAHLLSDQTIRDAGEHARPLIGLVLVAPLAAVMVIAAAADWLRGRGRRWLRCASSVPSHWWRHASSLPCWAWSSRTCSQ